MRADSHSDVIILRRHAGASLLLHSADADASIDLPLESKVSLFAQTAIAMETQGDGITVK